MAEHSVPVKYLDDITECPICTNIFSDPRVLPCIHTFCLKCIEGWAASRKQDELKLACPLCRKEITVTTEQVVELPKNLFVEKLLEVKRLTGSVKNKKLICEVCDESKAASVATVYCIECQQNMCSQCSASHKKIKVTASHRLVDAGSQKADALLVKLSDSSCMKHRSELIKIFCLECKTALCMMCYIKDHKSHDCADINEVAEELSQQMKDDCNDVDKTATAYRKRLENLSQKERVLVSKTCKAEKEIMDKCKEMTRAIETQKVALLAQLNAAKKHELKEIETLRHELEGQLMMIDSFKKYSQQLREKGSACDIAREVSGLRARAKELRGTGSLVNSTAETCAFDVHLSAVRYSAGQLKEIFGKLEFGNANVDKTPTDNFLSCRKPLIVMECGSGVMGIGTLGSEVFVVQLHTKHVNVYDATTFQVRRRLSLSSSATGENRGLAACSFTGNIYVSDVKGSMIHKVSANGKTHGVHWSVGDYPLGVSINCSNHVLVACRDANKLQEYTPFGVLVHEVLLQTDIERPVFAVQQPSGQYGLTHRDKQHRYCVIDASGKLVKSYGSSRGSGVGNLGDPYGLAVNKRGFVFVADSSNHRVLILDPTTFTVSNLSIYGGFDQPFCIHIDHACGRLYIGEWDGERLIVLG